MKITETQIRQVVKEEIHNVLNEGEQGNKVAMAIAAALGISYMSALTWIQNNHEEARQMQQMFQDVANSMRDVMGQEPINVMPPENK